MVTLKKNQAHLIKYSTTYCLKEGEQNLADSPIELKDDAEELDCLMRDFSPESDERDRLLLFLLTGKF